MRASTYHIIKTFLSFIFLLLIATQVFAKEVNVCSPRIAMHIKLQGGHKELSQGRNYYLSTTGNDSNDGQTPASAWRTIDKLNEIHFNAGDTLFLQGGSTFTGTIRIGKDDNGSYEQPFVITSFGKGKATIDAGTADGIFALNSSNTKILSLIIKGNGVDNNKASGIHFYSNDSVSAPSNIHVIDCEVKGFHNAGIVFGAHESTSVLAINM